MRIVTLFRIPQDLSRKRPGSLGMSQSYSEVGNSVIFCTNQESWDSRCVSFVFWQVFECKFFCLHHSLPEQRLCMSGESDLLIRFPFSIFLWTKLQIKMFWINESGGKFLL